MILRRLLDLPKTAPYEGILSELGIWKVRYTLYYRKVMLYHNILHSDEKRTIKKVVLSQEKNDETGTFWEDVRNIIEELGIQGDMKMLKKSELKKSVKVRVEKAMIEEMEKASKTKTKMRFIKIGDKFIRKEYTKEAGQLVRQTLITKLNMQPVYGNFKGDWSKRIMCPLCVLVDDSTEHLIQCVEGTRTISDPARFLQEDENIQQWWLVNDIIEKNFIKRKKLGLQ